MKKISRNQVALAGEFAVLSQLALNGFDANLTLGNTKSVDILLSNPETGVMRRLEVKTHSHNRVYNNKDFGQVVGQWRMSDKHESIRDEDLFYCFVSIQDDSNQFEFYVVPSAVVADFVTMSHKRWLQNEAKRRDNPMRSFMLGSNEFEYPVSMPRVEEYKRRWDLLG
jgi:hypothetical protein